MVRVVFVCLNLCLTVSIPMWYTVAVIHADVFHAAFAQLKLTAFSFPSSPRCAPPATPKASLRDGLSHGEPSATALKSLSIPI